MIARVVRLARRIVGLACIAAAGWWGVRALLQHHDRHVAAVLDDEFGLRITPLLPDEHREAIARELDVVGGIRL